MSVRLAPCAARVIDADAGESADSISNRPSLFFTTKETLNRYAPVRDPVPVAAVGACVGGRGTITRTVPSGSIARFREGLFVMTTHWLRIANCGFRVVESVTPVGRVSSVA